MSKKTKENLITIIDAPMGSGKTQAAINYINSSPGNKHFVYITPYLDEVDRIIAECPSKRFVKPECPNKHSRKITDLKKKLEKKENIATTHAMFSFFDERVMELCTEGNYVLILDEVADVIHPIENVHKEDMDFARECLLSLCENGMYEWSKKQAGYSNYGSRFSDFKRWADLGSLADYGNGSLILWLLPVKAFKCFSEAYVLTYMFDAQFQKYYYDLNEIKYKYMYIDGDSTETYCFSEQPRGYKNHHNYRELINIIDEPKLNNIGNGQTALSKNWYEQDLMTGGEQIAKLRNNALNFFKNKNVLYKDGKYVTSSSKHDLWTTFSDYKSLIAKGGGFSRGFIACNARATNKCKDRTVIAYLVNRFSNRTIYNFFSMRGIKIDDDAFALSEMLQFIWRSGIRDGKHITVYIPSRRMRELLIGWIKENSPEDCKPPVIEPPVAPMKKRKMERIEDWEENA